MWCVYSYRRVVHVFCHMTYIYIIEGSTSAHRIQCHGVFPGKSHPEGLYWAVQYAANSQFHFRAWTTWWCGCIATLPADQFHLQEHQSCIIYIYIHTYIYVPYQKIASFHDHSRPGRSDDTNHHTPIFEYILIYLYYQVISAAAYSKNVQGNYNEIIDVELTTHRHINSIYCIYERYSLKLLYSFWIQKTT